VTLAGTGVLDVAHDPVVDRWSVSVQLEEDAVQQIWSSALTLDSFETLGYGPGEAHAFGPDGAFLSIDSGQQSDDVWVFRYRRWEVGEPLIEVDAWSSQRRIERAYDLVAMPDGGYAMLLTTSTSVNASNPSFDRPVVVRTDEFGAPLWQRGFEGAALPHWTRRVDALEDVAFAPADLLVATEDGGLAVGLKLNGLYHLVRLDADGDPVWTSDSLGTTPAELPGLSSVVELADGTFACAGPGWIARLSDQGQSLPSTSFDFGGSAFFCTLSETDTAELRVAGWLDGSPLLAALDAEGALLWLRSFPLPGFSWSFPVRLALQPDGGAVLAGTFFADASDAVGLPTAGDRNAVLLKVDDNGDPVWWRVYGGLEDEVVHDLSATSDGGLVLSGYSDSFGDRREAWVARVGFDGVLSEGCLADLGSGTWPGPVVEVPALVLQTQGGGIEPAETDPVVVEADLVDWIGVPPVVASQCLGFPLAYQPEPDPGGDPEPGDDEFTLTLLFAGDGTGSVQVSPPGSECTSACTFVLPANTSAFLLPIADPGSVYSHFDGCDESSIEGCTVLMTQDRTVTVHFETLGG
jgi:hypothetical protein